MKNITIFDLDGTLSIVGDRIKYLQQYEKDWDSFYEACDEDEPNRIIMSIYKTLSNAGRYIKIVTGRRESVRIKTHIWLNDCGIAIKSKDIHMRPDGDFRHDTIAKPEMCADFLDKIEVVFEDRNSMVEKWRELGIVCLQVADGNF